MVISTDFGCMSAENGNYLCSLGFIDTKGHILNDPFNETVGMCSVYMTLCEDIRTKFADKPSSVNYNIDNILDLMRIGHISIEYTEYGMKYAYTVKYPSINTRQELERQYYQIRERLDINRFGTRKRKTSKASLENF